MSTHTSQLSTDAVLAAIFDPQLSPADLPAKTGLSLAELAKWLKANAQLVAEVREFLTQRATLIASRLHGSSLAALDRVIRECTDLERVRKAASTILRSLKPPTTAPRAVDASSPPTRTSAAPDLPSPISAPPSARVPAPLASAIDQLTRLQSFLPQEVAKRPSPAERFAALRLAKLANKSLAETT